MLAAIAKLFMVSPQKGAECSLYVALSKDVEGVTGAYFEKSKQTPASHDAAGTSSSRSASGS